MFDLIDKFNEAFNHHDVEAMMKMMTEECIFDNTFPAPDGSLYQGKEVVKQFWISFFANSPHARIEIEEMISCGDRIIQRWKYHWQESNGKKGFVRGVDIFLLQNSLIAEKRSYVKG